MKEIFLISPVRGIDEKKKALIEQYVLKLEQQGNRVYWPIRDTKQDGDPVGLRICFDNLLAMEKKDEVHVWYDPISEGSILDLGMAFALRKKIKLANPEMVKPTEGKSFRNVLLALHSMNYF